MKTSSCSVQKISLKFVYGFPRYRLDGPEFRRKFVALKMWITVRSYHFVPLTQSDVLTEKVSSRCIAFMVGDK